MIRAVLICTLGGLLISGSGLTFGLGQEKPKTAADNGWTVDDVILAEEAGGMQIGPDGKHVLWVKHVPDKEKNEMVAHLMLSSLTAARTVQLTRGKYSTSQPQWSPDGKRVAFLSARPGPKTAKSKRDDDEKEDEKTQIWLIDPFGGEPWPLTTSPRDIRTFAWKDDDTVLYVAQEKKSKLETDLKEKKDTAVVIDDEPNEPAVRLWTVQVKEKKSERFSDNVDRIQSLAVSPDGRWAATINERSLSYMFNHKIKPAVYLCDLDKKERKQIFAGNFNIAKIYWQKDSKGFYAINQFTNHKDFLMAYIEEPYHYSLADSKMTRVDLQWPRGLADSVEGFAITPDGFVALLADGVQHVAQRYVRKDDKWEPMKLEAKHVEQIRVSKDGKTLVFMQSTAASPPRWSRAVLDRGALKAPTELVDLSTDLRKKPMAKTELFQWKGALGEQIEGLISYPHDYQQGKKYPLIVLIHGGPHWADFDYWDERWAYVRNLLCARGAIVFKPNYHGSSHYGLAFAESIEKNYYLPVQDIEKGIDALIARGFADKSKIGLGGWSNGAILTMSLITRRHYQAASAGAGGSEWSADWGVCDFGMCFSNYYLGKSPIEDPELYRKNAPFYDFPKVTTPTILFHGSEDKDVPTHHSWYQFRALRELGKADVRFLLFPGEKHGLRKLTHRRRKVEEELAWYDKHLFQSTKPANVALKSDSPLGLALALHKTMKAGRLYGELKDGVLVPETVAYKGLSVGRFEVTRAQYAHFDKTFAVAPGTENFPANAITFEQAKQYCAWLGKTTGRPFRLGTVKEMTEIYDSAEGSENTLDHWAGYAITPEDRLKLEPTIKSLGGRAPLLKEVGSFNSADAKTAIFDLGGNVAEWADDSDKGRPLGGSADVPRDERGQRAPAAEYVGLRVVLGN